MPTGAEVEYAYPLRYPDMLVRGRANAVSAPVYGAAGTVVTVTASGSTFSLLDPSGTAIVDAAAVTVTDGVPSYTILAATLPATLTPLGEGWQEVWVLQTPDGERTIAREAALILRPLYPVVTYAVLLEDYPSLASYGLTATQWTGFIVSAWGEIVNDLIGAGHLPYMVMSPAAFRKAHKHRAYAKGFGQLALHQPNRGNFLEVAQSEAAKAKAAWDEINFKTDTDLDGRVDDDSRRVGGSGSILTINAPAPGNTQRRRARSPWL